MFSKPGKECQRLPYFIIVWSVMKSSLSEEDEVGGILYGLFHLLFHKIKNFLLICYDQ